MWCEAHVLGQAAHTARSSLPMALPVLRMDLATLVAREAHGGRWSTWCSEPDAMLRHIGATIQRLPPDVRPASVHWLLDGWANANVEDQHE